ncbi:MAG: adenylate cyclase, class 2 [Candidatus Argoarchaeum ethanivorans]|uniref:Adenylate cyclase, class 2 n=1 Tax=Candidatus Argoarchaeum ethanivorans TaxID=2608793 RepID=A0A8B3S182_9EURY|nr:MAG: adenylate cyclase, class 2 [Candidatus Argoarchaeum ethanivorans]
MIEVETKLRINNIERMEERLKGLKSTYKGEKTEMDLYFDHPDIRIFRSGSALRVRDANGVCRLTYKGPKKDDETTSREEIEIRIESAREMQKILVKLGFYKLCEVKKQRKTYFLGDLIVTLDNVEDLGKFIEVEGKASNDAEYMEKKNEIFTLLNELELLSEVISQRSYLEMLLDEKMC